MKEIDLLIHGAAQVLSCASNDGQPKRRTGLLETGSIAGGAVAVDEGCILELGASEDLLSRYTGRKTIYAGGKAVCPGFVDPHTHVVFSGDRVREFEMRIAGKTYQEIMAEGGGIVSTARSVGIASVEDLVRESLPRLEAMLKNGTTTAEVKTGYGLDLENELKLLAAIEILAQKQPIRLLPTFLGAHAIPVKYKNDPESYVRLVIEEMIPAARQWYQNSIFARQGIPFFCDVFCEVNAFSLEQSRRILTAATEAGMLPKIHADEFTALGGVSLAVELGAISVDHLDVTTAEEQLILAGSGTVGVMLPAVNFNLGSAHFADARGMVDAGCAVALSTDINPGSAPCPSMPLVMAISARYQRLMPAEILSACTINAAHAVQMSGLVGSLEPGKRADILILKTPDYRHLCYQFGENLVETVIVDGVVVSQA